MKYYVIMTHLPIHLLPPITLLPSMFYEAKIILKLTYTNFFKLEHMKYNSMC